MTKIYLLLILTVCTWSMAHAQKDSSAIKDSLLLIQLQSEMSAPPPAPVQTRSPVSSNPDISVIGDFRGYYQSNMKRNFNAELHETEFSFQSVVDPYVRADFFYSVTHDSAGGFQSEVEEGYLTTLALPAHLQLKVGKFKQNFGRINAVHPHALSFIDMPNAYVHYFGEEGLNDEGLSASWLLPNHSFFQELTVELTDGQRDGVSFARSTGNDFMKLAHLKNFWDLSQNATLELGLSGMNGANPFGYTSTLLAADLTYKWKPVQMNTYKSFAFQNEFYYSQAKIGSDTTVNSIGAYSMINYQIAKRTFLTARYDYSNLPNNASYIEQAYSLTFGWLATEFQKIEIEGKMTSANMEIASNNFYKNYNQVLLRWIFVIGTHGAHQY